MRVIAGEFRSRRLAAPRGSATRPTSDRLRETLFNVLGPRLAGARFADLYAGSGAVGIEALSRGAALSTFVEHAPSAVAAIRANLAALGIDRSRWEIDSRPIGRVLQDRREAGRRFELVFLDPPYEAMAEYNATLGALAAGAEHLLAPEALVIAEHARRVSLPTSLPARLGTLARSRLLEQGDAALSFYVVEIALKTGEG